MTKHDLKELAAMGAELGAAKAENERLRELLRDVEFRGLLTGWEPGLIGQITAALSPQAEPCQAQNGTCPGDGVNECKECPAKDEPAPAQDEREAYSSTLTQGELNLVRTVLSGTVTDELVSRVTSALAARPAQAEQQPVAWLHSRSGAVATESTKRAMEDGSVPSGYDIPLYAAPIAQTAPRSDCEWCAGAGHDPYGHLCQHCKRSDLFTTFAMHQRVRKTSGSEWQGRICGTYSTELTPEGYAVESEAHAGSVQIYPAKALEAV